MELTGANKLTGAGKLLFDGHAHVFESTLSMAPKRRYTPDYNATLDAYSKLLVDSGLGGAILVQPSFLGNDNSYMINAINRSRWHSQLSFYGVAVVDPGFTPRLLKRFSTQGIIGIRLNLVGKPLFTDKDFKRWKTIFDTVNSLGWHVELHCEGERLIHILPQLLDHCDTIVIDHFGLPNQTRQSRCKGQKLILSCPVERVFIKASAPYRVFPSLDTTQAADKCKKYFIPLLEHFGPSHLIWGSDWPWTQFENKHDYQTAMNWLDIWTSQFPHHKCMR